jgi:hypothetical protein
MLTALTAIGLVAIVGLAVRIGTTDAAEKAWGRIAVERRLLGERRRALDEHEVALSHERSELWRQSQILRATHTEDCPECGRRRERGERSAS